MTTTPERTGTSPWTWVAVGCLGAVAAIVAFFAIVGFLGYRVARSIGESQKNPQTRQEQAASILGSPKLPEGYNAMVAIAMPFLGDVVVLTDRAPDADGQIRTTGDHAFVFIRSKRFGGRNRQQMRDYFEGKTNDLDALKQNHINFDAGESITRGTLPDHAPPLMYTVNRGQLHIGGHSKEQVQVLVLPDCGEGSGTHMAIWAGPDPDPGQKLDAAKLKGTIGDPQVFVPFVDQFNLCH